MGVWEHMFSGQGRKIVPQEEYIPLKFSKSPTQLPDHL